MSERGIVCRMHQCHDLAHGVCHSDCPRIDKANQILQQVADELGNEHGFTDLVHVINEFLSEDKSWNPVAERKRREDMRKTTQCDPKTCKPGLTLCCYFRRLGDDYGSCIKSQTTCPYGGFVDVTKLEVK